MKTTEKQNNSWYLAKVELHKTIVLNIFTKAWNHRWWKIYSEDKVFLILSGKAEVTVFNGTEDIATMYTSESRPIKIPAWTPNIFYFSEDTEMLEWFSQDVETEKYERYRKQKPQDES